MENVCRYDLLQNNTNCSIMSFVSGVETLLSEQYLKKTLCFPDMKLFGLPNKYAPPKYFFHDLVVLKVCLKMRLKQTEVSQSGAFKCYWKT